MANLMLIEKRLGALYDRACGKAQEASHDDKASYWRGKRDAYRRALNEVRGALELPSQ